MAQGFFSRFFGSSSQSEESRRRAEDQQRAYEAGPPTLWERWTAPLSGNAWVMQWKRQRKEVQNTYWANKKRLTMERWRAEQELKKNLQRETDDIERYYRLHELRSDDPRFAAVRKKANQKIDIMTRQSSRQFKRSWQDQLRELQHDRDRQYRETTKNLRGPRFE